MCRKEFETLFQHLHDAFASFALCDDFALAATIPFLSTFFSDILLTFSSDHLTLSVPHLVLQELNLLCTGMILAYSLIHSFHINLR